MTAYVLSKCLCYTVLNYSAIGALIVTTKKLKLKKVKQFRTKVVYLSNLKWQSW